MLLKILNKRLMTVMLAFEQFNVTTVMENKLDHSEIDFIFVVYATKESIGNAYMTEVLVVDCVLYIEKLCNWRCRKINFDITWAKDVSVVLNGH